jgi:hypothetical protein
MWAARNYLGVAAIAALVGALGAWPSGAPLLAQESPLAPEAPATPPDTPTPNTVPGQPNAVASQVVAVYKVELAGFNLGDFRVTARFNGDDYDVRGEGRFSILQGLIYEWRGTSVGKGKLTSAGPEPAMYALSYRGGNEGEQLRMTFANGGVTDVAIVPKKKFNSRTIPVTKEQLEKVFDPLSGAFLYAHSDNPNGDLKVCEQTVPVFDGVQRFDLVLTPKKAVNVKRDAISTYAGPAVICHVRFIPIGGYQPDNPGIQLMSQTDEIEVWLVPVRGTAMYVPYRIVLPTPVGYGSALAKSFQVRGAQRASNDDDN